MSYLLDGDGRHIPGSAIDFVAVGSLHLVSELARVPAAQHRALVRSTSRFGPEKLIVSNIAAAVGDIVAQVTSKNRQTLLGRPMQVRAVDAGVAVLADDPSLGPPMVARPFLASVDGASLGGDAVWSVLDSWRIFRCPRCGAPGLHAGGNAGPPGPGYYASSCVVVEFAGSEQCARCDAEWTPNGRQSLVVQSIDNPTEPAAESMSRVAEIASERGLDMTLNAELMYDSTSGVLHFGGRAYGSGFLLVSRAENDEVDQLGRPYFDWRVVDGRGETMAFGEEYVDLDGAEHPVEMLARFIGDIAGRCENFPDDDDALLPPGQLHHSDGGWWVRHYVAPQLGELLGPVRAVIDQLDVV